jgi:hypothetical protein
MSGLHSENQTTIINAPESKKDKHTQGSMVTEQEMHFLDQQHRSSVFPLQKSHQMLSPFEMDQRILTLA